MNKYSDYKDSGIEWIGEIPKTWEVWKISHAFSEVGSGTTPKSGDPIYHENGTINWLNTGDLNDGTLYECKKKITEKAIEDYSALKLFPAKAIAIAMYGATIGKTSLLKFETTANQACCILSNSNIITDEFLFYWFIANKQEIINLAKGGGQPNISQDTIKALRVPAPVLPEQTTIANYLDRKTAEIDDLIAKKERLIDLYKEERTATINQAVTKGLDPTVPMKDSGIDWLGEIPEHWEVCHFKMISKRIEVGIAEAATQAYVEKGGVPILRATNIKNGKVKGKLLRVNNELAEKNKSKTIFTNDLVTVRTGYPGVTALIQDDLDGCQCFTMLITTLLEGNSPQFYNYYLNSNVGKSYFKLTAWGSAQKNISVPILSNIPTVKMLYDEQVLIADFIENASQEFGALIDKTENEIDLLKEYKSALISEVVLGKVDVREEALV